ncbi:lipid A phosphoethanolamine transferase [Flavobacterium nackdongense]|uniref:Lipid A phosphoethanolamine transferase n=2 Tax=Flavobacterium nackdongense TaxID=2547394 RepID=A0A4P6YIW3_9FLAO|nr:lipid A phosphoethanolamine transferase [Flavobacterium nackdongense]
MKLTLALVFCTIFSAQSQDTIKYSNPLAEVRFNFFKNSVILFNEYLDTDAGSFNTTNFRLLYPIGKKTFLLRFDVPLISTNTPSVNKTGLGDLAVAASYIPYVKNKMGMAVRAKITSNSASDLNFGTGKWVFTPTFILGNYLGNHKKYLWFSAVEQQLSFAGDQNRNDINVSVFENTLLYFFGKNWFGIDTAIRYNYTIDGFQNTAFVEFGRKFSSDSMFYIHPSLGYGGAKSYNYGFELGVLILF